MDRDNYQYKYEEILNRISSICCCLCNGDYCKHCWKFWMPGKIFCGKCKAFQEVITDLHCLLDTDDIENLIDNLIEENLKLSEYKMSKQASYESMQREWQGAVHLLREVQAENIKLKSENDKLKEIESIVLGVIARRPHSDNEIFERILDVIKGQKND